jgi:predicted naringenin-chalcone synthase
MMRDIGNPKWRTGFINQHSPSHPMTSTLSRPSASSPSRFPSSLRFQAARQPSSTHCRIGDFRIVDPPFSIPQEQLFTFLVGIFARAAVAQGEHTSFESASALYAKLFDRFGCSPKQLSRRFTYTEDFLLPPEEWKVFDPEDPLSLGGWSRRREAFKRFTEKIFTELFSGERVKPANLLHVTCTAYESPSAPQILASSQGWSSTTVTQVYHHGCHASVPALRVASGLVAGAMAQGRPEEATVDVVHTELHTLHADPVRRTPDQIVGHSLFGDGVVAYKMWSPGASNRGSHRSFELLATHEYIIPETSELMQWSIVDSGMHMILDKAIPDRIADHVNTFLHDLYERAGLVKSRDFPDSLLAIHPGGPRILDKVRDALNVTEDRMAWSRRVLHDRGNLSSATAPHMWADILSDDSIRSGTLVTTIVFGPGLTAAGAILRVV